ncbi:Terminase, large subunit [Erwinia phage VyarbaL]|nr:Terminase, large subunit [Erwinia phage VyarbaL]
MAKARESIQAAVERWELLAQLQEAFPNTVEGLLEFAEVVIHNLIPGRPHLNRIQADILRFMFTGNKYRMVEAQRGQAKTTIAAIYAVFCIIHRPHFRILISSQTSKRAEEIAGWVIKIFRGLDILDFMMPDIYSGDKASIRGFEIHYTLRGSGASPSVACYSIEGSMQGARADLIIADDVESLQNSATAAGRVKLEEATKEFESINQTGDILYLGTPQSINSIYNNLPARGYELRIWPGRYPTEEQQHCYGEYLAPLIVQDMLENPLLRRGGGINRLQGQPTCPEMYGDDALIEKEISQGTAKFQLQFMLNTRLSDSERFPLKLSSIIFGSFGVDKVPEMPLHSTDSLNEIKEAVRPGNKSSDRFFRMAPRPYDWKPATRRIMYIDPAGGGQNGDETGVAIVFLLGTYIYVYKCFGVKGGYDDADLEQIVMAAKEADCKEVFVEKNFGHGAFQAIIKPFFERMHPCELQEDYASGQKEERIIDTLEPLLTAHRLVFNTEIIQEDQRSIQKYALEKQSSYSLFNQIANITRDKGSLRHDDRLDALYGAVRQLTTDIDYDEMAKQSREQMEKARDYITMMNDPNQRRAFLYGATSGPSRARNITTAGANRTNNGRSVVRVRNVLNR